MDVKYKTLGPFPEFRLQRSNVYVHFFLKQILETLFTKLHIMHLVFFNNLLCIAIQWENAISKLQTQFKLRLIFLYILLNLNEIFMT